MSQACLNDFYHFWGQSWRKSRYRIDELCFKLLDFEIQLQFLLEDGFTKNQHYREYYWSKLHVLLPSCTRIFDPCFLFHLILWQFLNISVWVPLFNFSVKVLFRAALFNWLIICFELYLLKQIDWRTIISFSWIYSCAFLQLLYLLFWWLPCQRRLQVWVGLLCLSSAFWWLLRLFVKRIAFLRLKMLSELLHRYSFPIWVNISQLLKVFWKAICIIHKRSHFPWEFWISLFRDSFGFRFNNIQGCFQYSLAL